MRILTAFCFCLFLAAVTTAEPTTEPAKTRKVDLKVTEFDPFDSDPFRLVIPEFASVGVREGNLLLNNRAYVFAREPMGAKKTSLSFGFLWKDFTKDDTRHLYADHVLILLRSSGKVSKKRSYESEDGLRVRIVCGAGIVQLEKAKAGNDGELIKSAKLKKEEGQPAIAGDSLNTLAVTDDGKTVTVTLNGKEVLKASYTGKYAGKLIGIANRENVGFPHQLQLQNLRLQIED